MCNVRLIHSINMNIINPVCHQVYYLLCCINNTCLLHSVRIFSEALHNLIKLSGKRCIWKLQASLNLISVCNRHNSGYIRHVNLFYSAHFTEIIKFVIIKKHLSCNKIDAAVNLFLKPCDILNPVYRLRVSFRIARRTYAKLSPCLNFVYKLKSVVKILIFAHFKILRNIAP